MGTSIHNDYTHTVAVSARRFEGAPTLDSGIAIVRMERKGAWIGGAVTVHDGAGASYSLFGEL